MIKRMSFALCAILLFATVNISCNTSRTVKGAVIGATVGGATGAILSKNNRAVGIILGAAVGGVAGGLIGSYMDKQAKDIADDLDKDATVTRVGEGIVVSFDSGLLFDYDSYALRAETKSNLQTLSNSLKKYGDTDLKVLGHTDSKGSNAYNNTLSAQRAGSVESYLIAQGISTSRISINGYGESDPVADNATDAGRQLNRRVEVVIVANDALKESAKKGSLN